MSSAAPPLDRKKLSSPVVSVSFADRRCRKLKLTLWIGGDQRERDRAKNLKAQYVMVRRVAS